LKSGGYYFIEDWNIDERARIEGDDDFIKYGPNMTNFDSPVD